MGCLLLSCTEEEFVLLQYNASWSLFRPLDCSTSDRCSDLSLFIVISGTEKCLRSRTILYWTALPVYPTSSSSTRRYFRTLFYLLLSPSMESTTSTETLSIRDMYFNSVTQTLNVNCSVVLVYCTHFSIRACVAGKLVNLAADLLGTAMIQQ